MHEWWRRRTAAQLWVCRRVRFYTQWHAKDGDTSNDVHEKDEKTETDEQIVRKVLPPYYSYRNRVIHVKSLSTPSFLRASPFAFEAELQVNLKNETEMRVWVAQLGEHQKTTWESDKRTKQRGKADNNNNTNNIYYLYCAFSIKYSKVLHNSN